MTSPNKDLDLAEFRREARQWLEHNVPHRQRPDDSIASREFDLEWQRCQYDGGWAGISWPREYEGRGLSLAEQFVWYQEYVRAGGPYIGACFVGINHAGPTLITQGTAAQKNRHLARILRGEEVWCQGFSEPHAGSDLAALSTRGEIDGDELIVNGHKIWSSHAHLADYQELLIRTDPLAPRHKGLTWVICEMDLEGIEVRPIMTMAGTHHFAEVTYTDVHIPLANVVGGLGNGWSVAMANLEVERGQGLVLDQAELLHAISEICAYGSSRLESGKLDMTQDLAILRAEGFGMEAMIQEFLLAGQATGPEVSMLRLAHSELQQRAFRIAMDLLGPESLDLDSPQDLRARWVFDYLTSFKATIVAGTSDIQRNIIGERVLNLPRQR
jgi:alkylation response protein AidB-like acyl-CoA dehydrogenase